MQGGLNKLELDRLYRGVRHRLLGEALRALQIGGRTVLRRLGTGASGLVYAAFDPALDRDVAIKFVPCRDDAARQRVRDEARVLAGLSHPNVVAVYDTGIHEGDAFIVMALVHGVTLERWGQDHRDDPTAVLEVFGQIALGLGAVHAAGLVHRDVKPANVLVGQDGRPRLVDFGLAQAVNGPRGSESGSVNPGGTPGYRAPELLAGAPPTPASDQYALFASLAEVLAGDPSAALPTRLPRRLRALAARGRAQDPTQRLPDMAAVAVALRRASQAPVGPRTVAVASAVLLAAGLGGAMGWGRPSRCDAIVPLPLPSPTLRAGLVARASDVGAQVAQALDAAVAAYTREWTATYTTVCRATWEQHVQSEAQLDQRMGCLAEGRRALQVQLDSLDAADDATVTRGAEAVALLPSPDRCRDAPPGYDAGDPAVEAELAAAGAQRRLGKFALARPRLQAVLDGGTTTDAQRARAYLELASIDASRLDPAPAVAMLVDAIDAAHAAGRPDLEASAWIQRLHLTLARADDATTARAHLADARATVELGGSAADEIRLQSVVALIDKAEGDLAAADEGMTAALDAAEALRPAAPTLVATLLNNVAGIAAQRGDLPRARARYEGSLEIRRAVLGPAHPDVAMSEMNLAILCNEEGDPAAALVHFDAVLAVAAQVTGPDDPGLARVYLPRAQTLRALGRSADARRDAEHALGLAQADGSQVIVDRARAELERLP